MDGATKQALHDYLVQFVTEQKRDLMERVLGKRTRVLTVVLENFYQPHNISAAIRTCECFGIQDLHIIENRREYRVNPDIARGADKWVDLYRHQNNPSDTPSPCLEGLKEKGYRIVATTLREPALPLRELPLDQNIALCFGTEDDGLSAEILRNSDIKVQIPMLGFTRSFNVSVSVAICLYDLRARLEKERKDWALSAEERLEIKLHWIRGVLRNSAIMEREFLRAH